MDVTTARQAISSGVQVLGTNQWGRTHQGTLEAEWLLVKSRFGVDRMSRVSAPAAPEGTEWPVIYQLAFSFTAPNGMTMWSSADYTLDQLQLV